MDQYKEKHTLLAQGTYGCVYRPGFQCKTNKPTSKNFVSKLQVDNTGSLLEVEFGKRIKKNVRNYSLFFAPIVESCEINVTNIDERYMNQCEVYEKYKNKAFSSNKMEYVGDQTFCDFFIDFMSNTDSPDKMKRFLTKLVDAHTYLLSSLELLIQQNIIHADLKENNILYHNKNYTFVIIDLGLASDSKMLELSNYKKDVSKRPFGVQTDSYVPWALDLNLLSYIARQVQTQRVDGVYNALDPAIFDSVPTRTHIAEMKEIVTKYIETNPLFAKKCFTDKDLNEFEKRYHALIKSWRENTWGEIWTLIQVHYRSWDTYALNVTILRLLMDTNITDFLNENTKYKEVEKPVQNRLGDTIRMAFTGNAQDNLETVHFFKQYLEWLKTSILCGPAERPLPLDCIPKIKSFFSKIPKPMMNRWQLYVKDNIFTDKNRQQAKKQIKESLLDTVEAENKLRGQLAKIQVGRLDNPPPILGQ